MGNISLNRKHKSSRGFQKQFAWLYYDFLQHLFTSCIVWQHTHVAHCMIKSHIQVSYLYHVCIHRIVYIGTYIICHRVNHSQNGSSLFLSIFSFLLLLPLLPSNMKSHIESKCYHLEMWERRVYKKNSQFMLYIHILCYGRLR